MMVPIELTERKKNWGTNGISDDVQRSSLCVSGSNIYNIHRLNSNVFRHMNKCEKRTATS